MKCLKDLVQWCNVITEKGGRPDEIIAYVQSLEPQVEVATTNMFNLLQFFSMVFYFLFYTVYVVV